jgi:endo-1,4-beta-D-glucanase Y
MWKCTIATHHLGSGQANTSGTWHILLMPRGDGHRLECTLVCTPSGAVTHPHAERRVHTVYLRPSPRKRRRRLSAPCRRTKTARMGRYPFPHNQRLPHCTYPTRADHRDALAAFHAWRDEIVTRDGARGFARTRRRDTPDGVANSTVSEGIAYGMLIAVQFDDRALFDDFWGYAQLFLNKSGLMDWYIAPDGSAPLGVGAATDADEDMAWALVMAHRQWGTPDRQRYLDDAKRLITAIYETEVDHGNWPDLLLPGDDWRGRDVFNPSYFAPNQYRSFGDVTHQSKAWARVIDTGYRTLFASLNDDGGNTTNGLVPAWCTSEGTPVEAFPGALTNYQYDSARTPFRIIQDYQVSRDPRSVRYLEAITSFFANVGAENIVDGYSTNGNPQPDPRAPRPNPGSAVFVGCAAAGAMFDPKYRTFLDAAYERVRTGNLLARSRYYNHCWTVLSLLMLTGNFVTFE